MPEVVKRDGGVICYETFGSELDPPLVLIEGLGAQMVGWPVGLCRLLADSFRVIRFDNRDVGRSSHYPDVAYSIEDMADDVVELLSHLDAAPAHIVGQSMGGMIAQHLALRSPGSVATLTLLYTSASTRHLLVSERPGARHDSSGSEPTHELTRDQAVEAYVEQERACASAAYPFDEAWKRTLGGLMWDRCFDPEGIERQQRAVVQHLVDAADLRRITAPTLLVHGTGDRLIDHRASIELHDLIPDSRLWLVDGLGHEVNAAIWPELVRRIRENSDRRPPASGALSLDHRERRAGRP